MNPAQTNQRADIVAEAFWQFSLEVYARAGVKPALLDLQDRFGADVNLVLLACWLGQGGRKLAPELAGLLRQEAAIWQEQILGPLRKVRNRLREDLALSTEPGAATIQALRNEVLAAELSAERVEQNMLVSRLGGHTTGTDQTLEATIDNLRLVLRPQPVAIPNIAVLLSAIFPGCPMQEITIAAKKFLLQGETSAK